MRDLLEQKLARFEQLENDLIDPEVLSNPARIAAVAREHGSLAKLAKKYRRFKQISRRRSPKPRQMIDGDDAEMRELAEAGAARPARRARTALGRTARYDHRRRRRQPLARDHGNPRRHRRRRSRPLRPRPVRNVSHHADTKGWKIEILDHHATELGGFKEMILAIEGEGCLPRAAIRKRRPSRAARARDRNQGPHPHLGRHRGRAARAGRSRSRHQARRLSHRHVLRERPRRAARQQDGLGRAADALRNRHRRPVPGRKEPAQEQEQGAPRAGRPHLRGQEEEGSTPSGRPSARAWSAPAIAASGSAPTTSRKTA